MALIGAKQWAEWTGGKWEPEAPEGALAGASNDTRRLQPGQLFVAIRTERRDGHDFLANAAAAGAAGALVSRYVSDTDLPQLVVDDPLSALQRAARRLRESLDATVIGITGSCGKTTVKELLRRALGGPPSAQATEGNLNNLLGVPLTLLGLEPESCRHAVIEAGISEPGEMRRLAGMIQPDIAVFTAIGAAHLEALKTIDNVAVEKGMLATTGRSRAIYCGASCQPYLASLGDRSKQIVIKRVASPAAPGEYTLAFKEGRSEIALRTAAGLENYYCSGRSSALAGNVALAALIARDLGVSKNDLQERLDGWAPADLRGQWTRVGERGIYVDCYNANPMSMKDALETFEILSSKDRPRFFVLGCMEELGEAAAVMHEQLGREIPARPGDWVRLVGPHATKVARGLAERGIGQLNDKVIESVDELEEEVGAFEGDVLLKGSRLYRLEKVLDMIMSEEGRAQC